LYVVCYELSAAHRDLHSFPTRRSSDLGLDRLEHVLRLEVDVSDDRDLGLLRDRRQGFRVVRARARHPDDVTARGGQLGNLLQRAVDIRRVGGGHALHGDRVVTAHADRPDVQLPGLTPFRKHRGRSCGHAEIDGHRFLSRSAFCATADIPLASTIPARPHPAGHSRCPPSPRSDSAIQRQSGVCPAETRAGGASATVPLPYRNVTGLTMSATTISSEYAMNSKLTAYASGISFAVSNGPGSGRRVSLAKPRRTDSHSAPAMCPPSSGRIGSMFSTNRDRLTPASM